MAVVSFQYNNQIIIGVRLYGKGLGPGFLV